MLLSSASGPVEFSGDYLLLHSRHLEVLSIQDDLDELHALQPLPDCLPDWQGEAKNAYVDKLGEMTTLLVSVRAEVRSALGSLSRAMNELSDV